MVMHAVSPVRQFSRSGPGLLALAVVLLTGCGGPATVITGLVTLDGQPVAQAVLEFFPVSGKGRVSFTKADETGRYRVTVSPTKLSVVVTATKVDGQQQNPYDPDGPLIDRIINYLPSRYGYQEKTPLKVDPVENETTTIDLALTSVAK
jgi:hypothetical protein